MREVNQRNNSGHKSTADNSDDTGIGVEGKVSKIYDFNKEGDKLLAFYEVGIYKYVMDTDMKRKKNIFLISVLDIKSMAIRVVRLL